MTCIGTWVASFINRPFMADWDSEESCDTYVDQIKSLRTGTDEATRLCGHLHYLVFYFLPFSPPHFEDDSSRGASVWYGAQLKIIYIFPFHPVTAFPV